MNKLTAFVKRNKIACVAVLAVVLLLSAVGLFALLSGDDADIEPAQNTSQEESSDNESASGLEQALDEIDEILDEEESQSLDALDGFETQE